MTDDRKRKAGLAPGDPQSTSRYSDDTAKPATERPAFQGKLNARNRWQRPPRWRNPAGADALAQLEQLFGPPLKPWKRGRP